MKSIGAKGDETGEGRKGKREERREEEERRRLESEGRRDKRGGER